MTQGSSRNPRARLQREMRRSIQKSGQQRHPESRTTPNTLKGAGRRVGRGWPVLTQPQHPLPVGLVLQPLPLVDGAIPVVHLSPAAPLPTAPLTLVALAAGVEHRPVALDGSTKMAG